MPVYLDNNATTPLHEKSLQAMLPFLQTAVGNPSSLHRFGRAQRQAVETAREQVAALVDAHPEQVIFTSGGTEANNLVIKGLATQPEVNHMVVSTIEHLSVLEPVEQVAGDCEVEYIPVDKNGIVTVATLQNTLTRETKLVSVLSANNETGAVQDIKKLSAVTQDRDIWFHTDASQAIGKIKVSFRGWAVQAMTISSHKIYGPMGAGALILDKKVPLQATVHGGVQEKSYRAGTENVPAIVGFGVAAEIAKSEIDFRMAATRKLRDNFEAGLQSLSGVTIFSNYVERLPNTTQFSVPGIQGETLLMQLDHKGFAVSSGSACTSAKTEPSHVLHAMQVPDEVARGAVRVSFGAENSSEDVVNLLVALQKIINSVNNSAVMMAAAV